MKRCSAWSWLCAVEAGWGSQKSIGLTHRKGRLKFWGQLKLWSVGRGEGGFLLSQGSHSSALKIYQWIESGTLTLWGLIFPI